MGYLLTGLYIGSYTVYLSYCYQPNGYILVLLILPYGSYILGYLSSQGILYIGLVHLPHYLINLTIFLLTLSYSLLSFNLIL